MRRTARALSAALLAVTAAGSSPARAEEGGSGHYLPGSTSSAIDALADRPGLSVANGFRYFPASATSQIPIGGVTASSLDGSIYANSISVAYRTSIELLDGNYSFGGSFPVVWTDVSGAVAGSGSESHSASGIGDILLQPFMLGWITLDGDLRYEARLGVYAPTGKYQAGSFANAGKNYWTFEPAFGLSYLDSDTGLEASGFAGIDFNTKNTATDYLSGIQVHVDGTFAKHFSLPGGTGGLGASGFWYQQVTADSGSGATLGDFKGRAIGIGPAASYATKIGSADTAFELTWLPEIEVKNRVEGNPLWFKIRATF